MTNTVALTARRCSDPADCRCGHLLPHTVSVVVSDRAQWGDGWVVIRPPAGMAWGRVTRIARLARRGCWDPWNAAAAGDWQGV